MLIVNKLCGVRKKRVFFMSFAGKAYSDNPKAISEELYKVHGDSYEFVWAFKDKTKNSEIPGYIKKCTYGSFKMLYYLCTSKIWILNYPLYGGFYKSNKQIYVQTWHADRGFKKCLCDVNYNPNLAYESKLINYITTGSGFGENLFRTALLYNGKYLKVGSPRNDVFFLDTTAIQNTIRNKYSLKDEKLILYAPTFRERFVNTKQRVDLDFTQIVNILETSTPFKWKVMVRSHSVNAKEGMDINDSSVISVTDYPDVNEILQITDILITDYSSVAGDFALSGKTILLFQNDIADYSNYDREFYFDLSKTPFFRFEKSGDLYSFLKKYPEIDSVTNCKEILDFFHVYEKGLASRKVVDTIIKES